MPILTMQATPDIQIREAAETDVRQIRELFEAAYGSDYAFPQFFDGQFLRKLIHNNDCLMLIAEDPANRRVLGTGSVVYDVGAFTDLVGEFGRLVVHPEGRGRGIGRRLMEERLARVGRHLHVGLADNRVAHPFSQKISLRHGFAPVGYLPIHNGEPVALFARHFNDALTLRRNHPHLAAPIYWLADTALKNVGVANDAVVDETSHAYPDHDDFQLEEMEASGYSSLLRFERGRLRHRDIFGPVKLHFGLRALERHNTHYLLAKRDGKLVGAIGYARDNNIDSAVRIFELIYLNEEPVRFLLKAIERRCREDWQVDYVETDVNADAPRMQKTLIELGFLPVAYIPSAVFHNVERLDTVRMARYYRPISGEQNSLVDAMQPIAANVIQSFNRQWIEPFLATSLARTEVFQGLDQEQTARLANLFKTVRFQAGDWIVRRGTTDGKAYVVSAGQAHIFVDDGASVNTVNAGEFIGELALLDQAPHSACVRAAGTVEAAVIDDRDLSMLLQSRKDIGFTLYRNLARGLAAKLKRATSIMTETG